MAFRQANRIVFRTLASFPPQTITSAPPSDASTLISDTRMFNDHQVWGYAPWQVAGVPTFFLTQTAAETGGVGIVHGAWALCEFQSDGDASVLDPYRLPPLTTVQLERIGSLQMAGRVAIPNCSSGRMRRSVETRNVAADTSRLASVKKFFADLDPANDRVLDQPYQGQANCGFSGSDSTEPGP